MGLPIDARKSHGISRAAEASESRRTCNRRINCCATGMNAPYLAVVATGSLRVGVAAVDELHYGAELLEFNFRFVVELRQLGRTAAADVIRRAPTPNRIDRRRYQSAVAKPEVARPIGTAPRFRFQSDRIAVIRRPRIGDDFQHGGVRTGSTFVVDVAKSAPTGSGCVVDGMRSK